MGVVAFDGDRNFPFDSPGTVEFDSRRRRVRKPFKYLVAEKPPVLSVDIEDPGEDKRLVSADSVFWIEHIVLDLPRRDLCVLQVRKPGF